MYKKTLEEHLGARRMLVLKLRENERKKFREIAEQIGVNRTHVGIIYQQAVRMRNAYAKYKDDPLFHFPTRIFNVLHNMGLKTVDQIKEALRSGDLHPANYRRCRNYGWGSHIQIHALLGLPAPTGRPCKMVKCVHCGGFTPVRGQKPEKATHV